jgi:serine kinase of HPr protein (carbohydrate metabolism regulator)
MMRALVTGNFEGQTPVNNIHGTLVDLVGGGVLLRGPSGMGKSDLALRLMDRGAVLVADDQVILDARRRGLVGSAPDSLYGLIEVRGIGIMSLPAIKTALVKLVVDLTDADSVERLPEKAFVELEGVSLPCLRLHAFDVSTPQKIELAIRYPDQLGLGVEDYKKG